MGYWSKRTEQEVQESVTNKDYTGGYKFWPWLLWMRKAPTIALLMNLIFGWSGGLSVLRSDPSDWTGYGVIIFFGIFVPILVAFLIRRDYKESQKGITR